MSDDEDEKIRVPCECGKAYRVAHRKAGKRITCKACGKKLRVPGKPALSKSSRGHILLSVGIDPDSAERNWEEESSKTRTERVWKCSRCASPLESGEMKGAYVEGELVCTVCRAGVEDRRSEREQDERKKKNAEVALVTSMTPERARRLAFVYGALFFFGFAGPLWQLAGVRALIAFPVGLALAAMGGWMVFATRR